MPKPVNILLFLNATLFGDNIKKEVYTNLISTIHESLPQLQRYLKLRKKLLKVDELHMYDLFAPLVEEFKMDITYQQAKEEIKKSLSSTRRKLLENSSRRLR